MTTLAVGNIRSTTSGPPIIRNSSNVEIGWTCRAWLSYNGSNNTIRGSGNVSSVTINGTGDYTVNFTNPMPNENYSIAQASRWSDIGSMAGAFGAGWIEIARTSNSVQTTSLRLWGTYGVDQTLYGRNLFTIAVFC
jgi:hypothetical protein